MADAAGGSVVSLARPLLGLVDSGAQKKATFRTLASVRGQRLRRAAQLVASSPVPCLGSEWMRKLRLAYLFPRWKTAVRTETSDQGAFGGDTVVVVYAAHGFNTKRVFFGGWRAVEDRDLHWLSNSELQIQCSGEAYSC